ncbi:uncharacterized protein LOC144678544 [Cetorhinus maximus]
MKEFVDSRSEGPSKDVSSMGFRSESKEKVENKDSVPHPTPSPGDSTRSQWAPTSSLPVTALQGQDRGSTLPSTQSSPPSTNGQGHEGLQTSSPSATALPGLERQVRSTTLPSMPPSSAPTQPQGHEGLQTFSPSATALPGLERQGRSTMLPSMPSSPVPTSFQGHASPQALSSSVTSLPGLHGQERTSTLQSTSRPYSSAQLPHSTKSMDRTSLRPWNIVTATLTPSPNELVTEETRTVGAIDNPSSTTRRSRGPRVSDRDKRPSAAKRRGASGEASGGPGWRVGVLAAVLLLLAATLVVYVASKRSVSRLVSGEAWGSAHHCSPDVVTLVRYRRLSETSREEEQQAG